MRVLETSPGGPDRSPEERLRLAVLLDAINQLRRGPCHPAAREAAEWIRGETPGGNSSFSFAAICEVLDLEAGRLARALLAPLDGRESHGPALPRRQVRLEGVRSAPRRYRARDRAVAID